MEFEDMLRLFLGERAMFTEGMQYGSSMKSRIKDVIKKIEKSVDELDTDLRHKQLILRSTEKLKTTLKNIKKDDIASWMFIFEMFNIIGRLLGYDWQKGIKFKSLAYHQTEGQYYNEISTKGGDSLQHYYDEKDVITIRKEIYENLKQKGFSDFKISQALNTSEYQIKKLKSL